ncbi:MAG: hypothetical protein RIC35_24290 [Marinoscillum sp.]
MEALYKSGEIVYSKNPPNVKLVVRRYEDNVYCCRVYNHPRRIELLYDESNLQRSNNPTDKKHI